MTETGILFLGILTFFSSYRRLDMLEDERSEDIPGDRESDDGVESAVVDGEVVLCPGVVVGEIHQYECVHHGRLNDHHGRLQALQAVQLVPQI